MSVRRVLLWLGVFVFVFCQVPQIWAAWEWVRETGEFRNVDDIPRESAKAQFDHAEQLEQSENFKRALKEYRKLVKHFPDSILAARAQYRSGRCLEKLGKYTKVFDAYQVVLDKYAGFPEPESVIEHQFAIAEMFYNGKRKGLPFFGIKLFSGKSDAVEFFDQISKNAPFSEHAEKGKFMSGLILEERERYGDEEEGEGAISAYAVVVERFPNGQFADDAQFRIGMCYYRITKKSRHDEKAFKGAVRNFRRYITLFPKGEFVDEAKAKITELDFKAARGTFEVGEYYEKRGHDRAALIYYREVVEKYPLSEWAEKAEAKIRKLAPDEPEEVPSEEGE